MNMRDELNMVVDGVIGLAPPDVKCVRVRLSDIYQLIRCEESDAVKYKAVLRHVDQRIMSHKGQDWQMAITRGNPRKLRLVRMERAEAG